MTARIYRLERSGAINPARSGMAPDSAFDRLMSQHAPAALGAGRDVAGDGVQAHSKGDLYPCIIAVVERYHPLPEERGPLQGAPAYGSARDFALRRISVSYELTYRGRAEEYATWEDAASVARALLAGVLTAEAWNGRGRS